MSVAIFPVSRTRLLLLEDTEGVQAVASDVRGKDIYVKSG